MIYPQQVFNKLKVIAKACFTQRIGFGTATFISATLLIAGCATTQTTETQYIQEQIPVVFYDEFGEKPQLISYDEIFTLTRAQQRDFNRFRNSPANKDSLSNRVVAEYIDKFIEGFNYHSKTFSASESATLKEGNCLSLAILTTAVSRLARVEVGYELMHSTPVFEKQGNTILSSEHIRSVLHQPLTSEEMSYELIFQPVIRVDYFPIDSGHVKRKVKETEFVSMYFRNKAAEAIVAENYQAAFWFAIESLDYAPDNPHTINILALVYERAGYKADAEKIYSYGIRHSQDKLDLLTNYRNFLVSEKRIDEAKALENQIGGLEDQNPFDWLELAEEALAKGQLNNAEKYYQKMIDVAPYLHHGYSGLSRVAFARGHHNKARRYLNNAIERTFEPETRSLYEAKMSALIGYEVD
ncbi:hypothetical protein FLL45_07215 [Aliikangiella marina]|uniref:Uncharacterized protein n=1 Tax=Aliikangiella marina TaxID=1712262 RepID=A0A545TC07_9GAMM|nr:hypothetical protein [Aliikangiella marina]TQV74744.1 hypothetical protein FLL45_07215 [Aliikangiella marina]